MRDTDKLEDKFKNAMVGVSSKGIFDFIKDSQCTYDQFKTWLDEELYQANTRGYEEGYVDAKVYEN
jgi:hypothetical protein